MINYMDTIKQSLSAINKIPRFESGNAGTTPAALPSAASTFGVASHVSRRNCRIVNSHATQILAILFFSRDTSDAAIAASGQTVASGVQVLAGDSWEFAYDGTVKIGIVANGANTSYNFMCFDP